MRSSTPIASCLLLIVSAPLATAASGLVPAVDVQEKRLIDVVRFVEKNANVNVLLDAALADARVTIRLEGPMPWLESLRTIAGAVDADLRRITDQTVRMCAPTRVSLEFEDARYRDVCVALAKLSGLNIVVPGHLEEADRLVTVRLHRVRSRDALEVITRSVGLVVVDEAVGDGWRISPLEAKSEPAGRDRVRALEAEVTELPEELSRRPAAAPEEGRAKKDSPSGAGTADHAPASPRLPTGPHPAPAPSRR